MIALWKEIKKICRLLCGSNDTNIFGYKSTVANQLYLFYYLSGKIYYIDQIHHQVKYLWFGIMLCQTAILFSVGVTYSWYMYKIKCDLMMLYNVAISVGSLQSIVFGLPLFCRLYSDRIEKMIERVDAILMTRRRRSGHFERDEIIVHARKWFLHFISLYFTFFGLYLSICFFDVLLLYEEHKAKNYLYYAIPPPLIREYGDLQTYLIYNGVLSTSLLLLALQLWLVVAILLYWNIVCCDELVSISTNLDAEMCNLNKQFYDGNIQDWDSVFEIILLRCAKRLQNVNPLVNCLKEFTEINAAFVTLIGFVYGVACLHVMIRNEFALVLKLKFFTGFLFVDVLVYLCYWMGQNLNNSFWRVSHAVYSTPWYESVKIRKNVYVLLCQTQSMKDLVVFKIYGMLLNFYMRFLRAVYYFANVLHKVTTDL